MPNTPRKAFPSDLPEGLKPRLRLFLSIDLVGSTAFKQSRQAWLPALLDFYRDFDRIVHAQYRAFRQRSNAFVAPPEFWKSNGDELLYTCDLFHDDQPGPVKVRKGRLTSVPYSLEMNDVIVYNVNLVQPRRYADILKRQFDRLYAEGETSGTVMCIPLHPYLVGHPYRIAAFEDALSYITSHDKVWLATGREIAQHFNDHCFDAFAAAAHPVGAA